MFISYEDAKTKEEAEDRILESFGWSPAVTVEAEGGWQCFQFVTEWEIWENQK